MRVRGPGRGGSCPVLVGTLRGGDFAGWCVAVRSRRQTARGYTTRSAVRRFLVADGVAKADPAEDIEGPRRGRRLPKPLSTEEILRLTSLPDEREPRGSRDATLIDLFY